MKIRVIRGLYIKIATALNRHKKAVNGSKVLFLGVAYKPNIDDERESPALEIMDTVAYKGGEVRYHDPFISEVKTNAGNKFSSVVLSAKNLEEADVVVLTTNHSVFDMEFVQKHARLIVDMRNMIRDASKKVYKL